MNPNFVKRSLVGKSRFLQKCLLLLMLVSLLALAAQNFVDYKDVATRIGFAKYWNAEALYGHFDSDNEVQVENFGPEMPKALMTVPPPLNETQEKEVLLSLQLKAYNVLGGADGAVGFDWPAAITAAFAYSEDPTAGLDLTQLDERAALVAQAFEDLQKRAPNPLKERVPVTGPQINVAAIICGSRRAQGLAMIKSASVFAQDADLNVIVFSDAGTILDLGDDLLQLRWGSNLGGWDFKFELHLEWFPQDPENDWKSMWAQCATQRLFFPTLLPHIDSVMYFDSDIIIMTNLTEFWNILPHKMGSTKMVAAALNNELTASGWYTGGRLPVYRTNGFNAGVMLMNLTQMRDFHMQKRVLCIQTAFKELIKLADQDLLNVLYYMYQEHLYEFSCTYNFNWVHCGMPDGYTCYERDDVVNGKHVCFCEAARDTGVHVLHGNGGTFENEHLHFLKTVSKGFLKFDAVKDSPLELFSNFRQDYMSKPQNHCHILTADMLYNNADRYFKNIYKL